MRRVKIMGKSMVKKLLRRHDERFLNPRTLFFQVPYLCTICFCVSHLLPLLAVSLVEVCGSLSYVFGCCERLIQNVIQKYMLLHFLKLSCTSN